MKLKYFIMGAWSLLLASCYEDKGNYSYSDMETIEITLPEGVKAMAYAENIQMTPTVVSSVSGDIQADNSNYEFACKLNYRWVNEETREYEYWVDINPDKKKDINHPANFPAGTYYIWYSVTNKETGITTNAKGRVTLLSPSSEGWMVLSNTGADKTGRLDMISKNSAGQSVVAYDILGDKRPEIKNATQVLINPSKFYGKEAIHLLSHTGGFNLDIGNLTTNENMNIKALDFVLPTTPGEPISMTIVNAGGLIGPTSKLVVTSEGDAFAIRSNTYGAGFETPMNTDKGGNDATYKVSPLTGTSMARPGNSNCVLLYDVTNKRFVGWNYTAADNNICFPLSDPEDNAKKFSYNTGMDIVDMEGTRFSDGLVYSVLEDANKKRHIYGINLSGSKFTQESVYSDINAEHFNDAVAYAFHSQFPFVFWAHENKVYSYNLGSGTLNQMMELPAGESVTMLKFNLFVNMNLKDLVDHSDEFLAKQFNLIVGSSKGDGDKDGFVRFYKVDTNGQMSKAEEFSGFGKVVDVTYRERRAQ